MSDHDVELSPSGQARRAQILELALRRVRHRRHVRRAMTAAAICLLLVGALSLLVPTPSAPSTTETGIARITTTPNPVPRIATLSAPSVTPAPATWEVLDDQTLLLALRSAGRPATITRSEGRARVVFADNGQ